MLLLSRTPIFPQWEARGEQAERQTGWKQMKLKAQNGFTLSEFTERKEGPLRSPALSPLSISSTDLGGACRPHCWALREGFLGRPQSLPRVGPCPFDPCLEVLATALLLG